MSGGPRPFVSSEVPLYYQLATLIREKILTGEYQKDDQLPTQHTLAQDYGVSRLTAREALKQLEQEGLVRGERGRGTFVTGKRPFAGDIQMDGSIEDLIAMGLATSVRLLEAQKVPATAEEAAALGLAEGESVLRCQRLRLYGDEPYCYVLNTLPLAIGERIDRSHWEEGSVLKFIEDELGVPLREAKQHVRASLADPVLARWLNVRVGAPLLKVDYLIRTDDARPVERARLHYRSDVYSFTIDLKRNPDRSPGDGSPWLLRNHRIEK